MANCSECQATVGFGKLMYDVLNLILGLYCYGHMRHDSTSKTYSIVAWPLCRSSW